MPALYFQLKDPFPCGPLPGKDDSIGDDIEVYGESKILDLRSPLSKQVIDSAVRAFISFYFHRDCSEMRNTDDLLYIERCYYAWTSGKDPRDDVYGRLFVDRQGNGGMSDQGLTLWMLIQDLTDAFGVDYSSSNKYPIVIHDFPEEFFEVDSIKSLVEGFYFLNQFYNREINKEGL